MFRYVSAVWGAIGVIALLGFAIYRISNAMLPILDVPLSLVHWLALVANVVFMAYSEGYKGFQQNFSPRVAARVLYLSREANWVNGLLAPAFCLGYFGTTARRQKVTIIVTVSLVLLVTLVKQMPQPWRGIIDAGVVVGLTWGVVSFMIYVWQAFRRGEFPHSPELPLHYASTGTAINKG